MMNETPAISNMDIVSTIMEAAAHIHDTFAQFERIRESMRRRCDACVAGN